MKKRKTLRIPRKLKKRYKKLWEETYGCKAFYGSKAFIVKKSIAKTTSWQQTFDAVWGCEVRFKTKKS
jgi:hypothetical protein